MLDDLISKNYRLNPAMEMVYRELFVRELNKIGIPDNFYPVGGAANHGLLYMIARVLSELDVCSVLEFGAGQSTLLIDAINSKRTNPFRARTIEHDPIWGKVIGEKISHPVVVLPLQDRVVNGRAISYYEGDITEPDCVYDLVLIDGPPAYDQKNAYNRSGCLDFLLSALARDFVIIIDDAERYGEQVLAHELENIFRAENIDYLRSDKLAAKRQAVFCGGMFRIANYF